MKKIIKLFTFAFIFASASAAVPLHWTVETSRATPTTFEAYQGETLALEASLQSYGKPLEAPSNYSLYWQTNGMGSTYWSVPCPVPTSSLVGAPTNVLFATWSPTNDVGAKVYNCFIGQPGTIYHAAFQLRLRPSPGATPNVLPLPVKTLDFSKVFVLNPPYYTKVEADTRISNATNAIRRVNGAARILPKYLWCRDFYDSYPDDAKVYYDSRSNENVAAMCSSVRDGGFLYRNFDYPFDDRAEFVVRMAAGPNRFASVGVAQVGTNLTENFVTSGNPSRCYKWLPGATVDGINENGVACNINVVDGDPQTSGWHNTGDLHPLAAIRWILDNATNAQHAATYIAENIRFPQGWKQNFHYMISDESETYIVENGYANKVTGRAALTNFQLYPTRGSGEGQERYDSLMDGANITSQWWTLTYTANGYRASDLPGITGETLTQLFNYWENNPRESHRGETFGDQSWWQTIHTSIYDISNRIIRVAVQETDDWHVFQVPNSGVDEDLIRKIAEDASRNKLEGPTVAPSTDEEDRGKAADAKDVGDRLEEKLGLEGGEMSGDIGMGGHGLYGVGYIEAEGPIETTGDVIVGGSASFGGEVSVDLDLKTARDLYAEGDAFIGGDATVNGGLSAGSSTIGQVGLENGDVSYIYNGMYRNITDLHAAVGGKLDIEKTSGYWTGSKTYAKFDIVTKLNSSNFYVSLADGNAGHEPTASSTWWRSYTSLVDAAKFVNGSKIDAGIAEAKSYTDDATNGLGRTIQQSVTTTATSVATTIATRVAQENLSYLDHVTSPDPDYYMNGTAGGVTGYGYTYTTLDGSGHKHLAAWVPKVSGSFEVYDYGWGDRNPFVDWIRSKMGSTSIPILDNCKTEITGIGANTLADGTSRFREISEDVTFNRKSVNDDYYYYGDEELPILPITINITATTLEYYYYSGAYFNYVSIEEPGGWSYYWYDQYDGYEYTMYNFNVDYYYDSYCEISYQYSYYDWNYGEQVEGCAQFEVSFYNPSVGEYEFKKFGKVGEWLTTDYLNDHPFTNERFFTRTGRDGEYGDGPGYLVTKVGGMDQDIKIVSPTFTAAITGSGYSISNGTPSYVHTFSRGGMSDLFADPMGYLYRPPLKDLISAHGSNTADRCATANWAMLVCPFDQDTKANCDYAYRINVTGLDHASGIGGIVDTHADEPFRVCPELTYESQIVSGIPVTGWPSSTNFFTRYTISAPFSVVSTTIATGNHSAELVLRYEVMAERFVTPSDQTKEFAVLAATTTYQGVFKVQVTAAANAYENVFKKYARILTDRNNGMIYDDILNRWFRIRVRNGCSFLEVVPEVSWEGY